MNLALSDDSIVLLNKIDHFTKNLERKITDFEILTPSDTIIAKSLKDEATQLEKMVETMRTDTVAPYNDFVKKVNAKAKEYSLPIGAVKEKIVEKIKKYEMDVKREEERKAKIIEEIIKKIDNAKDMYELESISLSLPNEARNPTVQYCITIKSAKIIDELRKEELRQLREMEALMIEELARLKDDEGIRLRNIETQKREEERKKEEEERKKEDEKNISSSMREIENEIFIPVAKIKGTRTVWKMEILNPLLVPREFCTPSDSLIREAVKNGIREIDGVKIFEEIYV